MNFYSMIFGHNKIFLGMQNQNLASILGYLCWAVMFPRITSLMQTIGDAINLEFSWKKESEKEWTMVL